ncbi:helix-turn-helix transcriptional regulator [Nocardia stercoris]|uniref:DNA-binding response regulator n=1 Tax=Nocardia stercoris TaxID=2483361 RepID=A0A3M2L1U8_9NOCA|nr:LuxR C-terminal-related transcriptional regulator [Nocardia stercoris]RMI31364.1 DNA-binding response regulator [Nocardia stercoris]
MSSAADLLRPPDDDAVRAELRATAALTATSVVFGGQVHGDALVIDELVGARTNAMRGLVVASSAGLGGAAIATGVPRSVADYTASSSITHHYDAAVLGEGLHAVLAVPVVVSGRARAVLYAGDRERGPIAGRVADTMLAASRRLAAELAVRDEVDRRLRLLAARAALAGTPDTNSRLSEQLRDLHAELRGIAQSLPAGARDRLRAATDRLAALVSGTPAPGEPIDLAPRELDVLAQIALGCTNSEAAARLSLRPETVKSYLRSAMTRLGAHTRHEAVVRARRLGLLP